GTGYATALLAGRARSVVGADLSEGMLEVARSRLRREAHGNAELLHGDALGMMAAGAGFDLIFSSWVLGYIPLAPFFAAAAPALFSGGQLAFIVHKEHSPREPLEIFGRLIAREPAALLRRVAFDFPPGLGNVRAHLAAAGFEPRRLWEGAVTFRYPTAEGVLEHLLKSGAGTAFYEALDPRRRDDLTREFLEMLGAGNAGRGDFEVTHDYIACVAFLR
ncbi:MAG: methyltransferase domain-containing protein, partial [Acidobacteria bacterium]|nr:methyltransferase domain-containing protein [Acidobacteriota bacterium]